MIFVDTKETPLNMIYVFYFNNTETHFLIEPTLPLLCILVSCHDICCMTFFFTDFPVSAFDSQ